MTVIDYSKATQTLSQLSINKNNFSIVSMDTHPPRRIERLTKCIDLCENNKPEF